METCSQCGKESAKLLKCAACNGASYCGSKCQAAAWPAHKDACLAARSEKKVDVKSLAKKLIKLRLPKGQEATRDVKKTGKLLQMGFAAGCDDPRLALLALKALSTVTGQYLMEEPGAPADELRRFVRRVVPDLCHCGLANLEEPAGEPFCHELGMNLMAFTQVMLPDGWERKEINFHNEARRAGVLRLSAEVMRHWRPGESRPKAYCMKIQTSFYMFLHGFCLRSGEEVYQAHQAGLTECLEFALQNDLIESGSRASASQVLDSLRGPLGADTHEAPYVGVPRSMIDAALESGQFVCLPNIPESVYKRMGIPYEGPEGDIKISDAQLRRYVEHSQDPEAIQYLADKAAAMKKTAEMEAFDATGSGPYVDEDGYEFEAFVGDGAPATAAGATAPQPISEETLRALMLANRI